MSHPFYQPLLTSLQDVIQPLQSQLNIAAPRLESIQFHAFNQQELEVRMLRLDDIHPIISGNKWYKLKFNLAEALRLNADTLITFGGAWSNHLHALAYLGSVLQLKVVVLLRGEEWQQASNPLIDDLKKWDADIHYVDRQSYRQRHCADYQRSWLARYPNSYLIPEGGDNFYGLLGVSTLLDELSDAHSSWLKACDSAAVACGTGNTFAGLRLALPGAVDLLGISALKGGWFKRQMEQRFKRFRPFPQGRWQVFEQFHGRGFGKLTPEIKQFVADFEAETGLMLDPVYTAKLLYGIDHLSRQGFFTKGHRLMVVHTGGLQGRRSSLLNS